MTLRRWLRFNAVGIAGTAVQFVALWFMVRNGWPKPIAAALAVEAAVIHNFLLHERWTWKDRSRQGGAIRRFARFNFSNGAISIAGNAFIMWLLATRLDWPYLPVNILAVLICSGFNFAASDRLVFRAKHTSSLLRCSLVGIDCGSFTEANHGQKEAGIADRRRIVGVFRGRPGCCDAGAATGTSYGECVRRSGFANAVQGGSDLHSQRR